MKPNHIKVLLVDDDEDDYLITHDLLDDIDNQSFHLDWVATYEEGLETISQRQHDVYLIDYRLGARNGLELLREAIQMGSTAPFILLTGQGDHEVDIEAMEAGAADYLVKDRLDAPLLERSMRYAMTQKRSEEALRQSEARYRNVSEVISDFAFAFKVAPDGALICEWITEAYTRITGYTPAEIEDKGSWDSFGPVHSEDEEIIMARWASLLAGKKDTSEYRIITKAGETRWLRVHGYPKWDREERRIVSVYGAAQDITEQRQAEETQAQLESSLRQVQKMEAIGRLAGGIAHDFNNSLTIIMTCSELLLKRYLDDTEQSRQYVEEIREAGLRAAALTRQLLAFSRKQVLLPRLLNLNTLIKDLDKMLQRLIGEDIELRTEPHSNTGYIKADPSQLEQVIMNLVINARDAMPTGGKLLIETNQVELDEQYAKQHIGLEPGSYVVLTVSDTGLGMDKETVSRIFEPFFTTKEQGKGTGLGLATAYGIVQQSGGQIEVYSEVNVGTTFKIYLPQAKQSPKPVESEPILEEIRGGTETILVVEDEENVRELTGNILHERGYQVLIAGNGEEALRISQQYDGTIHLLLTDVIMPGMSGQDIAHSLDQVRPGIKKLYISGYTINIISHYGVLDSGTPIFEKPFTPDSLTRKVREVLDS